MEVNYSNENNTVTAVNDMSGSFEAIAVICFLMATAIILLNGLVIVILARQKGSNRLHFFIFHLAIADLCVGIVSVLGEGVFNGILQGEWFLGDAMCRMWRYSSFVVLVVSNNLLIGMSVDRYLAVRYPLRAITGEYRPYKAIVIGSWIMALLIPVWTFRYTEAVLYEQTYSCDITFQTDLGWKIYVTCTLLLVFFIPLLAITICYIGISVVVWKHWQKSRNLTEMKTILKESSMPSGHKTQNGGLLPKARIKTIKMTLIICFAFFICWLPATVFHILDVYRINVLDLRFYVVLQRLYPLNSACNPIIFLLFSKNLLPCFSPSCTETRGYESVGTITTTT